MDIPREGSYYAARRRRILVMLTLVCLAVSAVALVSRAMGRGIDRGGQDLSGVVIQHEYNEASFVTLIRNFADSLVYVDNSAQCYAAKVGDTVNGKTTASVPSTRAYAADWNC